MVADHKTRPRPETLSEIRMRTVFRILSDETIIRRPREILINQTGSPVRKASCRDRLVPERQPIRGRHIVSQISISKAEYKELVRIRYWRHIIGLQQVIVVVGDP